MKIYLSLISLLISLYATSQIEIIDKSKQLVIKAVPYDGSFMNFDDVMLSKEKKAGIIGRKITIIELFKIKKNNGEEISFTDIKKFENKTFDVVGYFNDYKDILKIKDEKEEYIFEPQSTDLFVINDYIDSIKNKLENKVFKFLKNKSKLTSLDNSTIIFDGNVDYKISKVGFGKVNFGYGIILEINSQSFIFPNKYFFDQPEKNGWINIIGSDILESKVTLIQKDAFENFSTKNKIFLNDIRSAKVKVGMTEDQCTIAWGDPNKILKKIGGYDKIFYYGDLGNSQILYFKGGILKLIK
jgi:hypothetical protein